MAYRAALFLFFLFSQVALEAKDPFFYVVFTSYNNEQWCIQNIKSVVEQDYTHWTGVYINDCSTDRTGLLVEEYIAKERLQDKIKVIHNPKRRGMLENIYRAVKKAKPHWVVITVDGDDTLRHNQVFTYLASIYRKKSPKVWMTYGNWETDPPGLMNSHCEAFPKKVIKKNRFRKYPFVTEQLRTFYAGLFQRIKKRHLTHKGKFYMAAGDVAIMLPLLEMSSKRHIHFVRDIIYNYNVQNPINDFRKNKELQTDADKIIRTKKRYKPLRNACW